MAYSIMKYHKMSVQLTLALMRKILIKLESLLQNGFNAQTKVVVYGAIVIVLTKLKESMFVPYAKLCFINFTLISTTHLR